ncbi:hypothetical protein HRG_003965 [Hirsutella rhossiliensis]|uniref:Mediator complex subunit 15 KIX domain-containing protein n=1 Tax=Hirsutella rhossiliensis TaxID=111463 RepID=A0A9P8N340_9HYPO|nr:uncharacterized protein HRG_03965 [Hirsutella rhossiliensis]KAH0965949.1 hypothetical protein HRG_03965 [Hirsutella rhossiliensis]
MAANMQHMAGVGQMMPQQMRKPANANQLQQLVYQTLLQHAQAPNALAWQANVSLNDRMGKTMDLISNITLAVGIEQIRAAEFGCNFEREAFIKSPNKEAYDQLMANKTMEFFKKRQANEPNLQNTLNAQAQAAQAQAQAQAMMNMQAQMGRGMGQAPQQGFQHLQHQMQASQIPQHAQQQPQAQQQPMGMGMGLQAGRGGMPPGLGGQQAMGMADKAKVMDLASKMMIQASEQQKSSARLHVQQRMPPQQLAEFQAQGKDPLLWFFQTQAFHMLKASMNQRLQQQGGAQNPNAGQAAMMQPQHSQQSLQRQNMMNAGQPNEFSQFTPNMESIKDQQMNGLMAQQAGQMVVPASNGGARNATPQPANQNMQQQSQQQQSQHQMQTQPQQQQQQQQGANLQQMKMNQAQPPQPHLQMKQMQGQGNMGGGIPPSQSPAMNTLNTPVSRPPSAMNAMGGPGMGQQGGMQFGDQRFNQGIQRPNNQAFSNMLNSMTPDQRQALHGLPPEKLNEVMRRWQNQRQEQMAMGAGQMNQNRPQNQFGGQMNMNMGGGQGPQGMQQPAGPGTGNQQQQMRMPMQNPQAQVIMDQMDLPPQVHNQIGQLPVEVKKWRDLKMWLNQNNNSLPPNIRASLVTLQQKQFHVLMQRRASMSGQNPGMNPAGMPGQMPNQQLGMQRPVGNIPPQVVQVTNQEISQIRSQKQNLAGMPEEQLRAMISHMKRQAWLQQQQQQMRAQQAQAQTQAQANTQAQAQAQQGGQNQMSGPSQASMQMQPTPQPHQPQQNRTPQPQPQGTPNTTGQSAAMQSSTPKQQPQQSQGPQGLSANDQSRNNRPQPPKNLKRPSTDEAADTTGPASAGSAPPRPTSQPVQQAPKGITSLTPQQVASLNPDQRAKYEQYLKMQMAGQGQQAANMMQQAAGTEALNRLKQLSQEEQRKFGQESLSEIPMNQQEHNDTAAKLQRISMDMKKVGRGLTKWYSITRDDARAKMFFRTRMRIMKQFCDGEAMRELNDKFSIRSSEIDQARAMLESMAKDLAASMMKSGMLKQASQAQQSQAASQNQGQPQPQQQQDQPVPLNAANLEKNTQALNKMNQQRPAAKANQVPPAPTAAQPPFPFGESSPHGNPSYIGKPKDMNLQLPPARKKQKTAGPQPGQAAQGATPSPKTSKNASPEMRRAPEPQKPVLLCKDPECSSSPLGFPNEQALQHHIDEEHVRPMEDPVKFVKENLALALGLDSDGSLKKATQASAAMSTSTSKQGLLTPGNMASTPMSQDMSMKRTPSAAGRPQDAKSAGKMDAGGAPRQGDGKPTDASGTLATRADPWAGCTIDPQAFIANLGWEKGIGLPNIVSEANMYRSLTPKDTPESSKDSGSSEPNSDISEGAALDIDVYWRNYENFDSDLLLDLHNANLEGDMMTKDVSGQTLDPMVLMEPSFGPAPDWDDINIDFTKPFELDTRFYSMAT